jgi:hypothetical protein
LFKNIPNLHHFNPNKLLKVVLLLLSGLGCYFGGSGGLGGFI